MRTRHTLIIATVAAAVIALAVKTIFFSAPKAEAEAIAGSINTDSISNPHRNQPNMQDLPIQDIKDPM